MNYYKVKISYKGTHFHGWQAQSVDTENEDKPTVQGMIHQALRKISNYQECSVSGTSRTDSGVHAIGQVARLKTPVKVEPEKLMLGLNSLLPPTIRVLECEICDQSFNPCRTFGSKEYHYYFSDRPVLNPLLCDLVAQVPGPLDIDLMNEAAKVFIGEHDFYNYYLRSSRAATTIRTIFECEVKKANFDPMGEDIYYIRIRGSGFLKQMVRYIAGALFDASKNKIELETIRTSLSNQQHDKLSQKAKAKGLHLVDLGTH